MLCGKKFQRTAEFCKSKPLRYGKLSKGRFNLCTWLSLMTTCTRVSLRSRRLEVAGERENGHARGRHARGALGSSGRKRERARARETRKGFLAGPFFLVPTISKRLLRRLQESESLDRGKENYDTKEIRGLIIPILLGLVDY